MNRQLLQFPVNIPLRFRDYSLRTKLILGNMLIIAIAIIGTGYYVYSRSQDAYLYLTTQLDQNVLQQAQENLNAVSNEQATKLENFFATMHRETSTVGSTLEGLLSKENIFSDGSYWNAAESLNQLSNGSWDNSNLEPASVFIPGKVELTVPLYSKLNTIRQLDFTVPTLLNNNPDIIAIYFGGASGETVYYPNIDLSALVPPDFDVTGRPWYVNAAPATNPQRNVVWSDPYLDAASHGLVVTCSIPVFGSGDSFRGVAAMDIQLNRITDVVSNIHIGESGYAFLIDKDQRLIALPEVGYQDFDATVETLPLGSIIDATKLNHIPPEFFVLLAKTASGESGLDTITLGGVERFIVYQTVPEVDYGLVIIVPSSELLAKSLATKQQIDQQTANTLTGSMVLVVVIMVIALIATLGIGNELTTPLRTLTKIAEGITKGDLNTEIKLQGQDEIGTLAKALNSMTSTLRETLQSLEQRIAARTRDLEIVADMGTTTASILDTDQLLQKVVDLTKERFHLYHSHIYLLDQEGKKLVLKAGAGEPGRIMAAEGHSISLDQEQSLVARAGRERVGVTVNDVTEVPDFLPNPLLPDTRSELAVPMLAGNNLVGVFDIQSEQIGRFSDSDISIQTTLAAQLASSIQNIRSYERSRDEAELQSLTNIIGQKIQRASTMEETLQIAIRELGTAIGASSVKAKIGQSNGDAG